MYRIESWRLASPRAEKRSSLSRVSELKLDSSWTFCSFRDERRDISLAVSADGYNCKIEINKQFLVSQFLDTQAC
jgi:hypothetical protein